MECCRRFPAALDLSLTVEPFSIEEELSYFTKAIYTTDPFLQLAIMPGSTIAELASSIASNTARINDFLASKSLPTPSFSQDGPSRSMIPQDAPEIEAARVEVIDDTLKLRNLILGPRDYLMSFTVSKRKSRHSASSMSRAAR